MNVLIGCEFSGIVREAFTKRGHYAVSVDLEPTEIKPATPQQHHVGDICEYLDDNADKFDLMIVHPPCTYLAVCANRWVNPDRELMITRAFIFSQKIWNCPIAKVALEQPKSRLATLWRRSDQIISPHQFGHAHITKETHLWLRGLPKLVPTDLRNGNSINPAIWMHGQSADRAKNRSRTFTGIATAMAEQWG